MNYDKNHFVNQVVWGLLASSSLQNVRGEYRVRFPGETTHLVSAHVSLRMSRISHPPLLWVENLCESKKKTKPFCHCNINHFKFNRV